MWAYHIVGPVVQYRNNAWHILMHPMYKSTFRGTGKEGTEWKQEKENERSQLCRFSAFALCFQLRSFIPLLFIFLVIAAGNFVRLVESFPSIKPLNLLQETDRLGPNGSRFTSFQAPSIRLTVAADGPVILSIFHTQTSGLLTALCTLGNCFCCELNFNETPSSSLLSLASSLCVYDPQEKQQHCCE